MSGGLIAVLIVVAIIVAAIATKRSLEVLFGGSVLAFLVLYRGQFLTEWTRAVQASLSENVWIILVCGLFGSMIALLQASKGSFGFLRIAERFCRTKKQTLLASFLLGILIFIDDYLNVMTIGICMKPLYDKHKLPREALAYLLDATGAPVCVLLPFSTWAVFFSGLFEKEKEVQALGYADGMSAYIRTIPFQFYPIFTLLVVLLFCLGGLPKLGSMKKAFERTETTGMTYSSASAQYNTTVVSTDTVGSVWNFLIPLGILVGVAIATEDLFVAVIIGIVVCAVQYLPRRLMTISEFTDNVIRGFASMLPVLAMLLMAFTLEKGLTTLGIAEYLIDLVTPVMSRQVFPCLTFLLVAGLTFVTGSNWGMTAVVIPVIFPLNAAVGANTILTMAAILSGGAFGSHACFYTDATLLSSQSAGIENMEHALSQLPYVLIASALSVAAYLVVGFAMG
ncbi:transporter, NhaC family [Lachnospiraceae bacterium NK3A20]|nr:transporter, NhaC family [Lachnospiraceae bacterium NK3A20]